MGRAAHRCALSGWPALGCLQGGQWRLIQFLIGLIILKRKVIMEKLRIPAREVVSDRGDEVVTTRGLGIGWTDVENDTDVNTNTDINQVVSIHNNSGGGLFGAQAQGGNMLLVLGLFLVGGVVLALGIGARARSSAKANKNKVKITNANNQN